MALVEQSRELELGSYVTITQGAKLKQVSYDSLRMWLRNHPEVPVMRIGTVIVVRKDELEKYRPLKTVTA